MSGPISWADSGGTPFGADGIWFNGRFIEGGRMVPLGIDRSDLPFPTRMMSGTTIVQTFYIGGDAPVTLTPLNMEFRFTVSEEADYWGIREAADLGIPAEMWFGWPVTDWWYVPGGEGTITGWRTSRKQPYGYVTGVSQSTYPPKAWIDTTLQTVITTGTPVSGEVKVLDTSGYQDVTTIALDPDTYTWLKVRYHPMMMMAINSMSEAYEVHNGLEFTVSLAEHLGGYYTPASGTTVL